MKNKRFLIPFILVSLLPLLLVAVFYTQLPQEIPMHWDLNGHVTYQSRSQIWWLAGLSPIMGIVLYLLPKIDPRKANYQRFEGAYTACCLVIQLFMTLMTGVILVESFAPGSLSVEKVVIGAMGLLFVFLGNFMPKIKSNYFSWFSYPLGSIQSGRLEQNPAVGRYSLCACGACIHGAGTASLFQ